VTSVDWETYPVLHTPDLPEKIEIVLIERPRRRLRARPKWRSAWCPAADRQRRVQCDRVRLRRCRFTPERVKAA